MFGIFLIQSFQEALVVWAAVALPIYVLAQLHRSRYAHPHPPVL